MEEKCFGTYVNSYVTLWIIVQFVSIDAELELSFRYPLQVNIFNKY